MSGILSGLLQYFSPMDFAIVATCAACVWRLWKDQRGVFKLWSLPFIFIGFATALSYFKTVPFEHPLWSVQDWWTLRNGWLARLLNITLGPSAFKVVILFLLVLFASLGGWMAWKRHWARAAMLGLLPVCFLLGFRPFGIQQERTSETLVRVDNLPAGFVQWVVRTQPAKTLDVVANKRDNRNWIQAPKGSALLVIHQPESEIPFFLRNMRNSEGARLDPLRYVRGTFNKPCTFKAGDLHRTPDGTWPIDSRVRPLPASTSVIAIEGHEFHPVLSDTTMYVVRQSGEVNMGYNLPRHTGGYIRSNADGRRTFKIWVIGYDDYQAFKSVAQTAP